jgi:hypothetical protein
LCHFLLLHCNCFLFSHCSCCCFLPLHFVAHYCLGTCSFTPLLCFIACSCLCVTNMPSFCVTKVSWTSSTFFACLQVWNFFFSSCLCLFYFFKILFNSIFDFFICWFV